MASLYRNLIVWQKSFSLAEQVYIATKDFPKEELYWLADQMRRASVSIPSNIAEWSGRGTNQEYIRFLNIAKWSCSEIETQILLAQKFAYISTETADILLGTCEEILKMLVALIKKL